MRYNTAIKSQVHVKQMQLPDMNNIMQPAIKCLKDWEVINLLVFVLLVGSSCHSDV